MKTCPIIPHAANLGKFRLKLRPADDSEMGIYRDNLSAIVIGGNFLSIIVIAKNSLDLSITVIAFVIYFVIADKLSRKTIFYARSV